MLISNEQFQLLIIHKTRSNFVADDEYSCNLLYCSILFSRITYIGCKNKLVYETDIVRLYHIVLHVCA